MHQVHAPEITLTSDTTATGVWALEDVVRLAPGVNLNGRGHYHETYEKVDGRVADQDVYADPAARGYVQSAVLRAHFAAVA